MTIGKGAVASKLESGDTPKTASILDAENLTQNRTMLLRNLPVLLPLLAAPALSQGTFLSPPHAYGDTANWIASYSFSTPKTRTQQADGHLVGSSVAMIRSMSFRGTQTNPFATARTTEVRIDMGYAVPTMGIQFDANYKPGSRTTVFPLKKVNLPDLTSPASTPPPFNVSFLFTSQFAYNKSDWLLWDVMTEKGSGGGSYRFEAFIGLPTRTNGLASQSGTGCVGSNNSSYLHSSRFIASGNSLSFIWESGGIPAFNPIAVGYAGVSDPNLNIGLCANLRTDALIPLGWASHRNNSGGTYETETVPWSAAYAGERFYTQMFYYEGGSIVLSNGASCTVPLIPGQSPSVSPSATRIYSVSGHGPNADAPVKKRAIPVLFGTN